MENKKINGILVVDKPKGWTSHDVVAKLKNVLKPSKIGHGGTLDPEATGVLIILLGSYTKRMESLLEHDKTYDISFELGRSTTTGDAEGETVVEIPPDEQSLINITEEKVQETLETFIGKGEQIAPWYSAVKVEGKKLYERARGKTPEELASLDQSISRPTREITVYDLELKSFTQGTKAKRPVGEMVVTCSSGTYTRVLAEDIGKKLGVPAYQTDLRRTRIGPYTLEGAVTVDHFEDIPFLLSSLKD